MNIAKWLKGVLKEVKFHLTLFLTINKFHTFSHREQNNNPIYQSDPEYQIEDHRGDIP